MGRQSREGCLTAIVICHGMSEKILVEAIRRTLRLPIKTFTNENGSSSIQIDSIMNVLNNTVFKSRRTFLKNYPSVMLDDKRRQRFRLYIWMDTDDASPEQIATFLSGDLFRDHWLHPWIVPIYCTPNLEAVFARVGMDCEKKKVAACTRFASSAMNSISDLQACSDQIRTIDQTNVHQLFDDCLTIASRRFHS